MAEFNYTIPIPQPNTNMFGGSFIQGLSAIEQIKSNRAQQELAQRLAPLQYKQAELGVRQAEMGVSSAEEDMRQKLVDKEIASAISKGADPAEIATLLPNASPGFVSKFPQLAQAITATKIGPLLERGEIRPEDKKTVNDALVLSFMLNPQEGNVFRSAIAAVPDPVRSEFGKQISMVTTAGLGGDNATAINRLQSLVDGLKNSENPQNKNLGEIVSKELESIKKQNKEGTLDQTGWYLRGTELSSLLGQSSIGKMIGDTAETYFKLKKTKAETERETAFGKKAQGESGVGRPLDKIDEKVVESYADSSIKMNETANNALDLYKKAEELNLGSGAPAQVKEAITRFFGGDDVTQFRTQIGGMLDAQALRNWKQAAPGSGAMSNTETARALSAMPSKTASPVILKDYLKAVVNTTARAENYEQAQVEWATNIGLARKAQEDTSIAGIPIKKGESFPDFKKRIVKQLGSTDFFEQMREESDNIENRKNEALKNRPPSDSNPIDFGKFEFSSDAIKMADEILNRSRK
jgi:hypothetical protein